MGWDAGRASRLLPFDATTIRLPGRRYKERRPARCGAPKELPHPLIPAGDGGGWRYFAAACATGFMPFFWITGTALGGVWNGPGSTARRRRAYTR
jgi:hypothetical protein